MKKLTDKESLYCKYFVGAANRNRAKAARMAGYSVKTAGAIGAELMRKPHIIERIKELESEQLAEFTEGSALIVSPDVKALILESYGGDVPAAMKSIERVITRHCRWRLNS